MKNTNDINEIILEPDPSRVMEGLRDTGYDFNMAMADLVDNSIAANATVIKVYINEMPGDNLKIFIADNGCGMDREGLLNAMKYGSKRRTDASSLGKFGLGLKTASTAFCRCLSLMSRGNDGVCRKVQWDLDEICKVNKWRLLEPEYTDDEFDILTDVAGDEGTGTLVIWEKIDRLLKDYKTHGAYNNALNKKREKLRFHFSLVYQKFIDSRFTEHPIKLYLDDVLVEPWDPFCNGEKGVSVTAEEKVKALCPDGSNAFFTVKAFVLPRKEHFSTPEAYKNAIINNDMQGFYIYRENRLIHYADWSDIWRNEPHFALARVEISFDHKLDEAFNVDIKKSRIHINEDIVDFLETLLTPSRREAQNRYRKLKQDDVSKSDGDEHSGSGLTISENAPSLEGSKTKVVDESTNQVEVTNGEGKFTTTIKILPPEDKKQHRVVAVDSIDGNILWEPSLINGEHAVSINRSHDFYLKVYGPNMDNANVIQGLDFLLWGLSEAELSTINEETQEQYEEMRNHVSRILKKLVKDFDYPEE